MSRNSFWFPHFVFNTWLIGGGFSQRCDHGIMLAVVAQWIRPRTHKMVHSGRTQFWGKSDLEFGQISGDLTKEWRQIDPGSGHYIPRQVDWFRIIVDPEWSLTPVFS